ncbi:MAG TPA: DNA repair protein RadC [Thermoanaerobaculia bacterium]|nr:DNA repair protein RadC [Thermoanaerobaculia bacterium]
MRPRPDSKRPRHQPGPLALKEPAGDCPRHRLASRGAEALSDAELLALLLGSSRPHLESAERIRTLLDEVGGLAGLRGAPMPALRRRGLLDAQAATLVAAVELARRLAFADVPHRHPLSQPADIARYLSLCFAGQEQEILGALLLNGRRHLLACCEVFRGTLHRVEVEPRPVLKQALLTGASIIVLFSTHPSGDPEPSAEDLLFTRRMAEAAKTLGLTLDDHLIVGEAGQWVSLRQRGRL